MYIGRFAPTPSGPLHFGSLLAALASYLDAKANNGKWLVRIEDLDLPRCPPGCADDILKTLEQFGLHWDDEVVYQSKRSELYASALAELKNKKMVYECSCSRKDIAAASMAGHVQGIYPQTCRYKDGSEFKVDLKAGHKAAFKAGQYAVRLRSMPGTVRFCDAIQGEQEFAIETHVGDFVLLRADGFFAYHLAVVVDDAAQNVSHIMRGADLLSSTPHHIYLQQLLQLHTPRYGHIPVATNAQGEKLSKQTLAPAIEVRHAVKHLKDALTFLRQEAPPGINSMDGLLKFAIANWKPEKIPRTVSLFQTFD